MYPDKTVGLAEWPDYIVGGSATRMLLIEN